MRLSITDEDDLEVILIAAVSQNNVIGKHGNIPWHSAEEQNHFKQTTIGFPIIAGRKTWESLKRPLRGRTNIILTYQNNYKAEDAKVFNSIEESLTYCERELFEKCFIIGGGEIFKQAIVFADKMIVSEMKLIVDGDSYFPLIDMNFWEESNKVDFDDFTIHTYIRKEKLNRKVFVTKN